MAPLATTAAQPSATNVVTHKQNARALRNTFFSVVADKGSEGGIIVATTRDLVDREADSKEKKIQLPSVA